MSLDETANRARLALMELVFDAAPPESRLAPQWRASGYFDARGDCVASLEIARLGLILDGETHGANGIRQVAVHPDWRGHGLSRDLMTAALATAPGLVLLYAETSDLYLRYGFRPVPQHAFMGAAPMPVGTRDARPLDLAGDRDLIDGLLARRAPVSNKCALFGAPGLFVDRIAEDRDIHIAHSATIDSIVAYEIVDSSLVLVDVVAETIPSLAAILGALGAQIVSIKTLFPPDKLDWTGQPVRDDTGLMIRGTLPPVMAAPFMLPPTTEF